MARKRISFRDPVWLIPMVIVVLGCSIQTLACSSTAGIAKRMPNGVLSMTARCPSLRRTSTDRSVAGAWRSALDPHR